MVLYQQGNNQLEFFDAVPFAREGDRCFPIVAHVGRPSESRANPWQGRHMPGASPLCRWWMWEVVPKGTGLILFLGRIWIFLLRFDKNGLVVVCRK